MRLDEFDLGLVQAVFGVELPVDFGDGAGPVDVGGGGEVLEGDKTPRLRFVSLSNLKNTKKRPCKFGKDIFLAIFSSGKVIKTSYTYKGLCNSIAR